MFNIVNHFEKENENHSETAPYTCQNTIIKKTKDTNASGYARGYEKRERLATVDGIVNWYNHYFI